MCKINKQKKLQNELTKPPVGKLIYIYNASDSPTAKEIPGHRNPK